MPGAKKAVFFDLGGTLLKMRRDMIFQGNWLPHQSSSGSLKQHSS